MKHLKINLDIQTKKKKFGVNKNGLIRYPFFYVRREMKKRIYFDNLDGLRFLCFLSVFFFHSFHTEYPYITNHPFYHFVKHFVFENGNLGVNFFFVLSGFLITYLLIEEKKLNGQINLKNFWLRRMLRIWPLFYFCVFFGFVIFPFLKHLFHQTPNETANVLYYLTFTNNFDFLLHGAPDASILGILWSVAIEEQFYLVWPVVLFFVPLKKLWIPFAAIIFSSLVLRAYYDNDQINEYHTLSCIGDMAVGAFGAWLICTSEKFKSYVENLSKVQIAFIYILFVLIYFTRDPYLFATYSLRIFERSFIAIIIALIILEQSFSVNSLFKMSGFKTISKLGIITYGLYCLHPIGILIAINCTKYLTINNHLWQVFLIDTPLALGLTILISKISYRYYEGPFLKLKEKLSFITK